MGLPQRKTVQGFTLIELLISMILLSGIVFTASLSFSIFGRYWSEQRDDFNQLAAEFRKRDALVDVISNISNYLIDGTRENAVYFFEGNEKQLRFVTSKPIFASNGLAYVELRITESPNKEDKDELWYYETSLQNVLFSHVEHPPALNRRLLLMEAVDIRFNYFGWADFTDFEESQYVGEGVAEWSAQYNAVETGLMPEAINLTWANNEPLLFRVPHDRRILQGYTQHSLRGG